MYFKALISANSVFSGKSLGLIGCLIRMVVRRERLLYVGSHVGVWCGEREACSTKDD